MGKGDIERVTLETAHMTATLFPDCGGIHMASSVMTMTELLEEMQTVIDIAHKLELSAADEEKR